MDPSRGESSSEDDSLVSNGGTPLPDIEMYNGAGHNFYRTNDIKDERVGIFSQLAIKDSWSHSLSHARGTYEKYADTNLSSFALIDSRPCASAS